MYLMRAGDVLILIGDYIVYHMLDMIQRIKAVIHGRDSSADPLDHLLESDTRGTGGLTQEEGVWDLNWVRERLGKWVLASGEGG